MAVPTIPSAISATAIQTEFGGSNPIAINEYYAGGSYVPSGTANATSVSIPTSGTIAYSNFSGATATLLQVRLIFVTSSSPFSPYNSIAYCYFRVAGDVDYYPGSSNAWLWASPAGSFTASDYKLRWVRTGGTSLINYSNMPSNGTYYSLGSQRYFGLQRTFVGSGSVNCNVSLAYNSNSVIIASNGASFFCTNGDL